MGELTRTAFRRKHNIVDLIKEKRRKKPVALATEFEIQVRRNMPTFMMDENLMSQSDEVTC